MLASLVCTLYAPPRLSPISNDELSGTGLDEETSTVCMPHMPGIIAGLSRLYYGSHQVLVVSGLLRNKRM